MQPPAQRSGPLNISPLVQTNLSETNPEAQLDIANVHSIATNSNPGSE